MCVCVCVRPRVCVFFFVAMLQCHLCLSTSVSISVAFPVHLCACLCGCLSFSLDVIVQVPCCVLPGAEQQPPSPGEQAALTRPAEVGCFLEGLDLDDKFLPLDQRLWKMKKQPPQSRMMVSV